jgi:hypothetical protein
MMRRLLGILTLIFFIPMWMLDMLLSWLFRRRVRPIEAWRDIWISWKIAYWY